MRIGYVNVQGLNSYCFQHLNSWIHSQTYNLLVVSETWFQNRNQYLSSSFLVAESSYPLNPHINRRQDGGLLALANPSLKSSITSFYSSRYVLGLDISGTRIGFVYFPPSLAIDKIEEELTNLGSVSYLLGDMNVRLGKLTGDKLSNERLRYQTIRHYTSSYHLSFQRNSNLDAISRTDHFFAATTQPWTYHWDVPFTTDHGLMRFELELKLKAPQTQSLDENVRFDFKPLINNVFQSHFASVFDDLYADRLLYNSELLIKSCCESMKIPSTSETQALIDCSYDIFVSSLYELMDINLHSYNSVDVKTKQDPIQLSSANPPKTVTESILKFKRSQRSLAFNNPIRSDDPTKSPLEECTTHYNNLYASDEEKPQIERVNETIFGLKFQWDLISQVTYSYPNHKSVGSDKIHVLVYKALGRSKYFQKIIQNLFQVYASTGLTPSNWSTCKLHLLLKDPANPTAPNTRPIALSPIIRRLFEKCLMRIWESSNESWLKLNYGQAGFRRGYSTISQLLLSDEISRRDNKFSIFLDLKAAFDSVSWNILNEILINRSCPPASRTLIMSLICRPANLLLSVNQSEISTITTSKGVFQGGGISALIFAIYIDPLACELNRGCSSHRPLALLYADDIQLKPASFEQGQQLLDVCTVYAQDFKLSWNIRKCGVVGDIPQDLLLDGSALPRVSFYKYLGVIHKSNRVDWHATFQLAAEKQRRFMDAIDNGNWHPRMKLIIYRTFVRPITEYVLAPTWLWATKASARRQETINLIKRAHQDGIKFVFGYQRHYQLMDFISGFGPYTHRLASLHGGLARCLNRLSKNNPLLAARRVYQLSSSSHHILPLCFKSAYNDRFEHLNRQTQQKTRWKTFLDMELKSQNRTLSAAYSTIAYYSPRNTLKDNSSTAFLLPKNDFQSIIAWRLNLAFIQRPCACGEPFTKAHLSCLLSNDIVFSQTAQSHDFQDQQAYLSTMSNALNFTVFDYLLNQLKFPQFLKLYSDLREMINNRQ